MTEADLETWLGENPFIVIYLLFLLSGSVLSILLLWRIRSRQNRIHRIQLPNWQIQPVDFGIFMVCLVLWFVVTGAVTASIFSWLNDGGVEPGPGSTILAGLFLQAGLLTIYMVFLRKHALPTQGPISPRLLPTGKAAALGLLCFLASLPLIISVSAAWTWMIEILRSMGFDLDLPLQEAVKLFLESENPLHVVGVVLLAVVVAPIVEEAVFRAGIFRFLKGRMPLVSAILISSVLFGLVHGNLQSFPGLTAVGAFLAITYNATGNLKVAIFFHSFFNLNSLILLTMAPDVG